jgi:SAM-dependent methyltransferase
VNALLEPECTVLDFGAGRGKWATRRTGFRLALLDLRQRARRVIGADVDVAVRENPLLHEALVIGADGRIPLPDASVDLIVAWAVLEHVQDPQATATELTRVLKPGGWLCAWTPNKWGLVGIGARLVPNRFHARVLKGVLRDARRHEDIFPTVYRMNTLRALRRLFPTDGFSHHGYTWAGPPAYHGNRMLLARIWQLLAWLSPSFLRPFLHVFIRRRSIGEDQDHRPAG